MIGRYKQKIRQVPFLQGRSNFFSAVLFDDCELCFDDEFRQLTIDTRGYQVIIELGDTDDWTNPQQYFDDEEPERGLHVMVIHQDDLEENNPLVKARLPEIKPSH